MKWLKTIVLVIALLVAGQVLAADALQRATKYAPLMSQIRSEHWPAAPTLEVAYGQVEQESQWKSTATLKTSRELGRGLTQMTIAYNADGSERFNIYKDAVKWKALKGWNYRDDPFNEKHQLTFLILQDKANYTSMTSLLVKTEDKWAGALVAYNAGLGTVLQRHSLAKASGVNHDAWFGGLDGVRLKYESKLLYGRNLGDMRNEYPRLIIKVRSPKYKLLAK